MGSRRTGALFTCLLVLFTFPALAQTDPLSIAGSWIDSSGAPLGLTAGDLADRRLNDHYRNAQNGATHIYYIQRHQGIEVFNALYSLTVTSGGQVVLPVSRFVPNLAAKINTTVPSLSAHAAVARAAQHLGITSASATAPPSLIFVPTGNKVRLAWDMTIEQDSNHIWILKIDAVTGDLLHKMNMVQSDSDTVYASRAESPNHGSGFPTPPGDGRVVVTGDAAHPIASPYGWHDTD